MKYNFFMRSIKEIFVIGHGPSSSHTMGPAFACDYILKKYPDAKFIKVSLLGSLALTGKGHLTDYIIDLKLKKIPHIIEFNLKRRPRHPNTLVFDIETGDGKVKRENVISIGGGTILTKDHPYFEKNEDVYPHKNLKEILKYCEEEKISLVDYVLRFEKPDIRDYMEKVYQAMKECRERGLKATGELPGSLHVQRKANEMYQSALKIKDGLKNIHMMMAVTSFAVAEENAAGGVVVIAPTCGSAGVVPGAIMYCQMKEFGHDNIINGLLVAGLFGILAKTNASVSGAEAGCQAEIGVACAMAAALVGTAQNFSNNDIAQSAEIALEHSLGLTCDPVCGYVQIPCIERCAMFALKAVNAATLAKLIPASIAKVSYDDILKTMYQTGKDMDSGYRETSAEGLARFVKR